MLAVAQQGLLHGPEHVLLAELVNLMGSKLLPVGQFARQGQQKGFF